MITLLKELFQPAVKENSIAAAIEIKEIPANIWWS